MSKRGGARQGAGRKKKVDEQELVERLTPMSDDAYKALNKAIKGNQNWAVKLWFEYMYGKPKQQTDITTNGNDITTPVINFTNANKSK